MGRGQVIHLGQAEPNGLSYDIPRQTGDDCSAKKGLQPLLGGEGRVVKTLTFWVELEFDRPRLFLAA